MPVSPLVASDLGPAACEKALLGKLVESGKTSLLPLSHVKMSGLQVPQASPGRHWQEGATIHSCVFNATFGPFAAVLL